MFTALLVLAFYIAKPFLAAVVAGALAAYLAYPLYEKVRLYVRYKPLAAFLATIFVVLVFAVPAVLVVSLAFQEAQYYASYIQANGAHLGSNFLAVICQNQQWLMCRATKSMLSLLPDSNPDYYISLAEQKMSMFIISNVEGFISSILYMLFDFFIMIFVVYYLLKDGYYIYSRAKELLPVKESHKERVLGRFRAITGAVFYGNISIAAIQGLLGAFVFLALGLDSPFFWGLVMGLFAFVPYIGTAIIWIPASLSLVFSGYIQNSYIPLVKGVILLAYGIMVLSTIEHFLKPKIIGDKAEVHPLLVLIGVLGGLRMFGLTGIILGPVILALVITFVEIYEDEQK